MGFIVQPLLFFFGSMYFTQSDGFALRVDLIKLNAMDISSEWTKFDPNDPATHPSECTEVEMKYSNGKSFTGTYGAGFLMHSGLMDEETMKLEEAWRYLPKTA